MNNFLYMNSYSYTDSYLIKTTRIAENSAFTTPYVTYYRYKEVILYSVLTIVPWHCGILPICMPQDACLQKSYFFVTFFF